MNICWPLNFCSVWYYDCASSLIDQSTDQLTYYLLIPELFYRYLHYSHVINLNKMLDCMHWFSLFEAIQAENIAIVLPPQKGKDRPVDCQAIF